jgi:hypothetical protein
LVRFKISRVKWLTSKGKVSLEEKLKDCGFRLTISNLQKKKNDFGKN